MSPDLGFTQTDWSMIMRAIDGVDDGSGDAMETLARRYWPAVYAFIRSAGRDVHEAADLTQGFFCDVILKNCLLEVADRERGRFRNLLLRSLDNYMLQLDRRGASRKRSHRGREALSLGPDDLASFAVDSSETPQEAFDRQWGSLLVRQVLGGVERSCERDGLGVHWAVFEARVLRPVVTGKAPEAYAELVVRLGLADEATASNMMVTMKRRVARAIYDEVAGTVERRGDVDAELADLLKSLERR